MSVTSLPLVAALRPNVAPPPARNFSRFHPGSAVVFLFLSAFIAVVSANAQILEFPLLTSPARPQGMTFAPDGAYWFTEFGTARIGRVDTNGNVSEPFFFYTNAGPFCIVVGPDSNLWFTEEVVDKVGRISRGTNGSFTNGVLTEFPIHPNVPISQYTNSAPAGIAVGPDSNLWFVEYSGNLIGVMNTNGQTLHEYGAGILQSNSQIYNIAAGPDGAMWFTEVTYGAIGRIIPGTNGAFATNGTVTQFTIPFGYSNCEPVDIIAGPDGAMWFTEFNSNRIGRLTTNLSYSDFVLPTISPYQNYYYSQEPYYLTVGGDGNIWFTEYLGGNVSRITLSGYITEFPPTYVSSYPTCIASGPDKNVWFGQYYANEVAEFLLPTLTITLTNSQYVLTWPDTASDFILQGNTNLTTTNWIDITTLSTPPAIISNYYVYTNTITNFDYFRLYEDAIP